MELNFISKNNIDALVIDNVLPKGVFDSAVKELNYIIDNVEFNHASIIATAAKHNVDKKILLSKRNGVFFNDLVGEDKLFKEVKDCVYLRNYSLVIEELTKCKNRGTLPPMFNFYLSTELDFTLMGYYKVGDYYKPHCDKSIFTSVFFIFNEPKKFDGGNLILHDLDYEVEYKNNRMVIFPSWVTHEVTKIENNYIQLPLKDCRYTYSTFHTNAVRVSVIKDENGSVVCKASDEIVN